MRKILFIGLLLFSGTLYADSYPYTANYYCGSLSKSVSLSSTPDAACAKLVPIYSGSSVTQYSYVMAANGPHSYPSGRCYLKNALGSTITSCSIVEDATCPYGGSQSVAYGPCVNAPACPDGQTRNAITGACGLPSKNNGGSSNDCSKGNNIDVANPINAGTGNKWQHETDLPGGAFGLAFDRYYNASTTAMPSSLGAGWSHAYSRSSTVQSSGTGVTIQRNDGKAYNFQQNAGAWVADADVPDRLEELKDSANVRTGWRYTAADNAVETYNLTGQPIAIADRSGLTQTLTYSNTSTPVAIATAANLLIRVTDSFGRQLNFTYDANSRIKTLTDPGGGLFQYVYDTNNNLKSVVYPDGKRKTYHYENTAFPHALTGITDENGKRFATYAYDAQGRATSSQHAGAAERVSLVYNADGTTTVTDALNTARTYTFQTLFGVVKPTGQSQPGGSGCDASASALTYDANGNVHSSTDFNGNLTSYIYDLNRNLETRRTEGLTPYGATTPETRTISTVWHPTFRLPVTITNANRQIIYVYNSRGDISQKTIKDLTTNNTRSWNTVYTYSAIVPGALLKKIENGPRTDVSDATTYDYYPADASCAGGHLGCRGQLKQMTSPLGHVTQVSRYSRYGQPEQLIAPNGLITTLVYDARQRLTSVDVGGEITTYHYDFVGQLTDVSGPDGAYLAYTYDPAHRLKTITDNLGNTLTYTLDAMGNRIREDLRDPDGQLARTQSRVYDPLSRLKNLVLPQ